MKKILVIDTDTELLSLLQGQLRQAGFDVICSQSGQEGLSLVQNADLAIISVEMPDMNGFVICSNIKKDSKISHVPVILMSSANDTKAFERHCALPTHAEGYFLKPLDLEALIEEINAIVYPADGEELEIDQPSEEATNDSEEIVNSIAVNDMSLFSEIDSESLKEDEEEAAPAPAPEAPKASSSVATRIPAPIKPIATPSSPAASVTKIPGLPPKPTGFPKPGQVGKLPSVPKAATAKPISPAAPASPATSTPAAPHVPAAASTPAPASSSATASAVRQPSTITQAVPSSFPKTTSLSGLSGARIGSAEHKSGVAHTISASASFTAVSQSASQSAELSRLNDEITVLKNEINLLKSEITTRDNRITMLQSQCDALTSRCQNAESIADQLRAETLEISAQYDEIAQNDAERTAQIEAFIAADNEKTEQINNMIATDNEKTEQINNLIAADNEKTSQIEALTHAASEKNAQIEALAKQLLALIQQ